MARQPPGWLPRAWVERITDFIAAGRGCVTVEAPPGYGKHTLFGVLAGLPGSTILDVATLPLGDQSNVVGALQLGADNWSGPIVVIGRYIDIADRGDRETVRIGPATLALTIEETAEFAASIGDQFEALAPSITALCSGWPSYTEAVVRSAQLGPGFSAAQLFELRRGPHLDDLIERCTRSFSASFVGAFGALAQFDEFTAAMAETLAGADAIGRAKAGGMAIFQRASGWYGLAEPVRTHLRLQSVLSRESAIEVSGHLTTAAGVVRGCRMLVSAGQPSVAASLLGDVPVHKLDDCEQTELTALLRALLHTEKDDGSLHLRIARAFHNRGELGEQRRALSEAATIANDQLRFDHALEADAELLLLDLSNLPAEKAAQRHAKLVEQADEHSSVFCRVRLREIEAALKANDGSLTEGYRSVSIFNEVADEWEVVGEKARAAATLRMMTAICHAHLGTYADGIASMERACSLVAERPQAFVKSIELLARMAALAADESRFTEASSTAERLAAGNELNWTHLFRAWSAMVVAGFAGDAQGVRSHHRRANTLLGDLANHQTGVVFHAESAIAHALVGEATGAHAALKRANEHRAADDLEVAMAQATVESRVGDPALVDEIIAKARLDIEIPVEREWRFELEGIVADLRAGGCVDRAALGSVMESAERIGLGALARSLAESGGLGQEPGVVSVNVLGTFRVFRGGELLNLPDGNPTNLIKMLAVHGKRLSVDVVIDQIWPDTDLQKGRRRLKNVVSRARGFLGGSAIVRKGDGLELGPDVTVDIQAFRALLSDEQLSSPTIERATEAIDLYSGPLLESDVYFDWFTEERERARASALRAFKTAIDSGQVSPAWAIDAATRIKPDSEDVYLDVAELALERNDRSTARDCLRLAGQLCAQLGLVEPLRLRDVRARVGG